MPTYQGDVLTGRLQRVLRASVVTLLLGGLVGLNVTDASSDAGQDELLGDAATEAAQAPPSPTEATAPPTTAPKATTAKPRKSATTTTVPLPAAQASGWDFPFTLTPLCVKVGGTLTATARLLPKSGIAMMAAYADGDAHETWKAALAPEDGVVTVTWPVPPVPGIASMTAQASKPGTDETGVKTIPFRVVEATQSC